MAGCGVVASGQGYRYTEKDLTGFFEDKDISILTLVNPDNPSGNYIDMSGVLALAEWTKERGIALIVDESFVDFADIEDSLLDSTLLDEYSNMAVVKSISKSFGVPGFRLGVLASGNTEMIAFVKRDVAIWNINSYGEFFLQIFEKYEKDYKAAMRQFCATKAEFEERLRGIEGIEPLPSRANFVMCEIKGGISAADLTARLLCDEGVFIKDLSYKSGIEGEWIRLAIRLPEEKERAASALKRILAG